MINARHVAGGAAAVKRIVGYLKNERGATGEARQEGYYAKDASPSQWLGSGAAAQGLAGRVDAKDLERVLSGITHNGEDISKRGGRDLESRRLGTDLTISAPKSVSMLAVADPRILAVHDQAVAAAAQEIERSMIHARTGKGGAATEYTQSMIAAAFRHEDARPDNNGVVHPSLHTHLFIANMTHRADGEWVAARLDFGSGENIMRTVDEVYKSALARGLSELGYDLEQTQAAFEIRGISREQVEAFSGRSRDMAEDLAKRGLTRETADEGQRLAAQQRTRHEKKQPGHDEQRWEWRERLRAEGVDATRIMQEARERAGQRAQAPEQDQDERAPADLAIESAIRHLGERETVISQKALELEAMRQSMGRFGIDEVRQAIDRRAGGLLDAGRIDRDGTGKLEQRFSTKTHLLREAEILQRARDGWGTAEAIVPAGPEPMQDPVFLMTNEEGATYGNQWEGSDEPGLDAVEPLSQQRLRRLQGGALDADQERQNPDLLQDDAGADRPGHGDVRRASGSGGAGAENARVAAIIGAQEQAQGFQFSAGQRAGVALALTSTDRHLGIVGYAGAGKTTSMALIVEQYRAAGYEVTGVAPSAAAAKELESAGCNETRTLASVLAREPGAPGTKRLYLLDEAGMVSARDYQAFFRRAEAEGARTLNIGDPRQLASVESGAAFQQLLDTGSLDHVRIEEIQRQTDPALRAIAQAFAEGRGAEAVALARPYMRQVQSEPGGGEDKKTATRRAIAEAAAAEYLGLSAEERRGTLLLAGTNETRRAINAIVRAGLIERGELGQEAVTISALDKADMTREQARQAKNYAPGMVVEDRKGRRARVAGIEDGKILTAEGQRIDPWRERLAAYQPREIELRGGDQVMFRAADRNRGVINGTSGTVVIEDGQAFVETRGGRRVALDPARAEMIDYAYARTVHSSQGATVERAIVVGESSRAATAQTAYVACSREKSGLSIITDDADRLAARWAKFAERETALDHVDAGEQRAVLRDAVVQEQEQKQQQEQAQGAGQHLGHDQAQEQAQMPKREQEQDAAAELTQGSGVMSGTELELELE